MVTTIMLPPTFGGLVNFAGKESSEAEVIEPLRKLTGGKTYSRPPEIEAKLKELYATSDDEIIRRCEITSEDDDGFVPPECLVHLVRIRRHCVDADLTFALLFDALFTRVLAHLPKEPKWEGVGEASERSDVRLLASTRFKELMLLDRKNGYDDRLDIYEVRFAMAVANLRKDAKKKTLRHARRTTEVGSFERDIELSDREQEQIAIGDLNIFEKSGSEDYRILLCAAIDRLPDEYRTVVELYQLGIPFESTKPDVVPISEIISRSPKTARKYLNEAIGLLKSMIEEKQYNDK